jgi:hypothetical protein
MVQHMSYALLFTKVRFGMWTEVLAEPAPPDDLPYMRALWHAARALAFAAEGNMKEAEAERAALAPLKEDATLKTLNVSSVNRASDIAAIAFDVVSGEIAARRKRAAEAERAYASAVTREDALTYMEPPDWPIPVRQLQGAALLSLGKWKEAEAAFRADLKKFPENGWALSGLHTSLARQSRAAEAAAVDVRQAHAWRNADTPLAGGRVAQSQS